MKMKANSIAMFTAILHLKHLWYHLVCCVSKMRLVFDMVSEPTECVLPAPSEKR